MTTSPAFVYLLHSTKGATYVGATVDLTRRLRQHNQEIKGGASYTGMRVQRGETWQRVIYLSGFPSWQAALQVEWSWKYWTRKTACSRGTTPLERRILALQHLMELPRATSKAVPFAEWPTPMQVHVEDGEVDVSILQEDRIIKEFARNNGQELFGRESSEGICAQGNDQAGETVGDLHV